MPDPKVADNHGCSAVPGAINGAVDPLSWHHVPRPASRTLAMFYYGMDFARPLQWWRLPASAVGLCVLGLGNQFRIYSVYYDIALARTPPAPRNTTSYGYVLFCPVQHVPGLQSAISCGACSRRTYATAFRATPTGQQSMLASTGPRA